MNNKQLPGKILIDYDTIINRVKELSNQIMNDLQSDELIVIGELNGCFFFMTELLQFMDKSINPVIDFVQASSYGNNTTSSGIVKIYTDIHVDIKDKNVLLVDDIADTALTMFTLVEKYKLLGPKIFKTCVLLNKSARRKIDFTPDYIGFEVKDVFLFGHGLDPYRNARDIYELTEEI